MLNEASRMERMDGFQELLSRMDFFFFFLPPNEAEAWPECSPHPSESIKAIFITKTLCSALALKYMNLKRM